MTSVTVSVAASWRLGRVEINTPLGVPQSVVGYGEVLLQEPEKPSEGANIFRVSGMPFAGGEPGKIYGTMPGAPVFRTIEDVLKDTIDVNGTPVSFEAILEVMRGFMEKWRIEDASKPPVTPMTPGPGAELTPIPPPPLPPDIPPSAQPKPGDN